MDNSNWMDVVIDVPLKYDLKITFFDYFRMRVVSLEDVLRSSYQG